MEKWKYRKTDAELAGELSEQVKFLRLSASQFDSGHIAEAKRLATIACILLHDGKRQSKSLLGLLGLKTKIKFPSTAKANGFGLPLVNIYLHDTATFVPKLDSSQDIKNLGFDDWWNETVYAPGWNHNLSRKDLAFTMRNQDGGSHVDEEITSQTYYLLMKEGTPIVSYAEHADQGVVVFVNNEPFYIVKEHRPANSMPPRVISERRPIPNGHLATMRQITWEIDVALRSVGW